MMLRELRTRGRTGCARATLTRAIDAPSNARALAVAKEVGLDMDRLQKDMKSPEVKTTLEENFKLAEALGLNGTPSYVIGEKVVVGAVGLPALQADVNTATCGKATC